MTKPLRVLVVEDEAAILMQLEAMIEDHGHEVVATAMSSSEAIALINQTTPDLMLLDLHLLDGATGLDVARHARSAGTTEMVFMTANASRVAADFEGAIGVLAKPCSRVALSATFRYLTECLRAPPPISRPPLEFAVAPAFARRMHAHPAA